ncbi:hypothetical protein ACK8N7_36055 [Streptomyces griseobrunneus]|uniref:hypothetical protein n=1 Tax=Streptomyces microflavus TaxID=1919 RepID=UPI0037F58E84
MFGIVTEVFDTVVDVLVVAMGLGCVWLGMEAVLRPRRPPEPIQGPVWVVRTWGIGFVVLGICLAVQMVVLTTGGDADGVADVMRWVAGPLVAGSILAAFVIRLRERRWTRAARGRRQT